MNQRKIPWEEISSKLKGIATPSQSKIIKDWLKQSDDNLKIYQEIINSWQLSRKQSDFYQPDMDKLWIKLISRIDIQAKSKLRLNDNLRWIAAAAITVIVFLSGIYIGEFELSTLENHYSCVSTPLGSRTKIMLPDSTSVWLNSGAEIRYPSVFNKETRDVHISGECFFDVTKDSKRQFIVHTDNLNIKIFGTRFNVKEYNDEKRTEISLVEGKVEVFNKSDRPYTELNPNEQFVLSDRKAAVKRIKNINALIAWTKNIIIFEDEPFEDVIQTLESWYGVDINFEEHMLNNHSYTFKVKTESLREVLDLISVITPIRYEIDGEIVNIKYK